MPTADGHTLEEKMNWAEVKDEKIVLVWMFNPYTRTKRILSNPKGEEGEVYFLDSRLDDWKHVDTLQREERRQCIDAWLERGDLPKVQRVVDDGQPFSWNHTPGRDVLNRWIEAHYPPPKEESHLRSGFLLGE
jgi:hypothetical protein